MGADYQLCIAGSQGANSWLDHLQRSSVGRCWHGENLASEVAEYGITVNNLGPGPTTTDRALELAAKRAEKQGLSVEQVLEQTAQSIPVGRLARPRGAGSSRCVSASQWGAYITGVSLVVDGGAVRACKSSRSSELCAACFTRHTTKCICDVS